MAPSSSEWNNTAGVSIKPNRKKDQKQKECHNVAKCGKRAWREANLKVWSDFSSEDLDSNAIPNTYKLRNLTQAT